MSLYSRIEECVVDINSFTLLKRFKDEIDSAEADSVWMGFLERAGIDNSEAWEYAIQLRNEAGQADKETT
jgi:hypothetical protein